MFHATVLLAAALGLEPGSADAVTAPPPVVVAAEDLDIPGRSALIDADASAITFAVRMRWFSRVEGDFARFRGQVRAYWEGSRQVEVEVEAGSLDVGGRRRMTEWASSDEFFDVENHPLIVFVSDPFNPALAATGGPLNGDLTLRGVTRRVGFTMLPVQCPRAGRDCPIRVEGRVSRAFFDMTAHRMAVQDQVELSFEVWLQDGGDGSP